MDANTLHLFFVCSWVVEAFLSAAIAARKDRPVVGWFFFGLLGGLIGLLVILFLPSKKLRCPWCAERVRREALVCRHCGRDLPDPRLAAARTYVRYP